MIIMEGVLKKKVSILRGFEDKWFELKDNGFLEYYELKPSSALQQGDVPACNLKCFKNGFGKRAGGILGLTWKTKFFVLCESGFQYFDSDTLTKPRRTVPIEDIKGVSNADGYGNKEHVFQIATKYKTFYIEVDNADECKRWMTEISKCLKELDSKLLNKDNRILMDRIYIVLAALSVDRDDTTFRVVTNNGRTYILRATSRTERQQWLDNITEVQRSVSRKKSVFKRPTITIFSGEAGSKVELKQKLSCEPNEKLLLKTKPQVASAIGDIANALKDNESKGDNTEHLQGGIQNPETPILQPRDQKAYSKENCLLVASIDFGSSASGCAYSFRNEFKLNPLNIEILSMDGQANRKSPTIVLLNPKGEFADFGARAQQKFSDLALDGNDKDWYYFRRFKMQLYKNKKINQDMILEDINGREMNACDVFSFCMEYIKNKVYTKASQALAGLKEEQIHWMITVPAIWSDSARQFMIDAAERAGIDRDLLSLVLEPEAAAVYCKHIEINRKEIGQEACLHVFEPGSQFMVVDLGGGTVDITCNEVLGSKKLREVYSASGGPWGGNMINQRIWKHIRTLFRKEQFDKFIKENTNCQIDLLKAIEEAKMKMKPHQNSVIKIPEYIFEACTYDSNSAEIDGGKRKLVLSSDTIVKVFEACCVQVCRHLKNVLERKENVQIKTMLLVGGYSACEMLKDGIKKAFPKIHIISPVDCPETIVLRGAVLMGHESRPIVRRIAKYHYVLSKPLGLRILSRSTMQQDAIVNDELLYLPLINKGDPLNIGNQIAQYIFVVEAENLQETEIDILSCEDEKPPKSLIENFTKIGKINIRMPGLNVSTEIQVVVSCQETEFMISAVLESGERFNAMCNFLL